MSNLKVFKISEYMKFSKSLLLLLISNCIVFREHNLYDINPLVLVRICSVVQCVINLCKHFYVLKNIVHFLIIGCRILELLIRSKMLIGLFKSSISLLIFFLLTDQRLRVKISSSNCGFVIFPCKYQFLLYYLVCYRFRLVYLFAG